MTALRQRMLEDMRARNLSPQTQLAYVQQVRPLCPSGGRFHDALGTEEIRAYQVYLTKTRQLAPASLVVAVAALRFVYRTTLQKVWPIEMVIPAPKQPQTLLWPLAIGLTGGFMIGLELLVRPALFPRDLFATLVLLLPAADRAYRIDYDPTCRRCRATRWIVEHLDWFPAWSGWRRPAGRHPPWRPG